MGFVYQLQFNIKTWKYLGDTTWDEMEYFQSCPIKPEGRGK